MDRQQAVDEMKRVFAVLSADVRAITNYDNFANDEAAHRSLIRAHFALIEGMVYQLRSVALASGAHAGIYSPEEIAVLREKSYSLNQKGAIAARDSYEKILPMILFSMRTYAKIHGATFEPDVGAHGWEAMQKYVRIRNALTHPKTLSDLTVDRCKTEISTSANDWFQENLLALLKACDEADESYAPGRG